MILYQRKEERKTCPETRNSDTFITIMIWGSKLINSAVLSRSFPITFMIFMLSALLRAADAIFGAVITMVTSVLILHERFTAIDACGIVLTLAGLFLSEKRVQNKEAFYESKHGLYAGAFRDDIYQDVHYL